MVVLGAPASLEDHAERSLRLRDRWTGLYTRAVNIRLLASGASQRAIVIGADVKVSGVVLTRHGSADRTLPAIRHPSAPRAQQALRLSHLTLLSPVPRRRESGSR